MSDKASRWLDLVAFLLSRHYGATREEIFSNVSGYDGKGESARRKFERDKDELRALGVDIETISKPNAAGDEAAQGYRLRPRSTYLPYLELADEPSNDRPYQGLNRLTLTRDELDILDRSLRSLAEQRDTPFAAAAASARRKLAFDLPFDPVVAERTLAHPVPEYARQALEVLQEAVIDRAAVTCQYFTMSRRSEEARELEPWGLLFQWGRWYCVARARDRDEPRLFRVDRMRDVKRLPGKDHFKLPKDFHVRALAGRSPWEFGSGPVTTAVVRFTFPESRWVANSGVGTMVREEPDHSQVMRFELRDTDAFQRWLLTFGRQAEVLEPESLRDSLTALRADIAAMYAEAES
jgi:predicted DNA-binding transcriptional regulator YafY